MTAPVGTASFTTVDSKESERQHSLWVNDVIKEKGPDWTLRKSVKVSDILATKGMDNEYALRINGDSNEINSDGGFIFYKDKMVGCAENKYQTARQNACERALKYGTFVPWRGCFISVDGTGFIKKRGSHATGTFIEMARFAGATLVENANETEFKNAFRKMLEGLV
jgi:hypothetical protein